MIRGPSRLRDLVSVASILLVVGFLEGRSGAQEAVAVAPAEVSAEVVRDATPLPLPPAAREVANDVLSTWRTAPAMDPAVMDLAEEVESARGLTLFVASGGTFPNGEDPAIALRASSIRLRALFDQLTDPLAHPERAALREQATPRLDVLTASLDAIASEPISAMRVERAQALSAVISQDTAPVAVPVGPLPTRTHFGVDPQSDVLE